MDNQTRVPSEKEPADYSKLYECINADPLTQSLLYDLNLLPEQTSDDPQRFFYTLSVVEHMRIKNKQMLIKYLKAQHEKHKEQNNHFACAARTLEEETLDKLT